MKADITEQEPDQLQEARVQRARVKLKEQKDETHSLLEGGGSTPQPQGPPREQEKIMPTKSEKIANRNDKVTVQYQNGEVMKDVKYKKVEEDIKSGKCIVIEG